ncbi:MAG: MarR family transcriptional regulator [Dehalococcoides mccartyi]|jgi:DNA-binding MarR family transcriptional regulator|uniref:MarR family winged helix-turn-helix transcriptional regulator n=1 Tax=Dehalococcoides TaxID=61434 RepID=UPI0002B7631F|nr:MULTISPECIES: MarR family winged helix-turn-helix transcriptional regulator [Dehalococcoides]AGG08526.1 transcriptional regulator, MarR family [Dehalococcoides mccartyi BTF08]OBW62777.1 MAG: MarR family transcriptional regulator [Dehalococcoides mccartyi]
MPSNNTFEIWSMLMQARAGAYNVRRKELLETGITPEQAGILNILHVERDTVVTPAKISKIFLREPHTVSVTLKSMEAKGLLELRKDLERRNMIRVVITEAGENARNNAFLLNKVQKIFEDFSEEEIEQLKGLLRKVRDKSINELSTPKVKPNYDLNILHNYDTEISRKNNS